MRQTEYYELSMLQWKKLLQLRQNQLYVEMMMRKLQLRMTSRLSRPTAKHVPLYGVLLKRLTQLIQQVDDEARQVRPLSHYRLYETSACRLCQ